jgi:hypothetical protein
MNALVFSITRHRLLRLKRRVDAAREVTPLLMIEILQAACGNVGQRQRVPDIHAIRSFVRDRAWTDAALALLGSAVPEWRLRRICHEDRLWWCALERSDCRSWAEPEIDESHQNMTLALLKALIVAMSCELEKPGAFLRPPATMRG